jgi:hypothetical protein
MNDISEKEQFYDDHIAPVLLELAGKCNERGLSFLAFVEYDQNKTARTSQFMKDAGLEMWMVAMMMQSAPNLDSFMINFMKFCREENIDTSASMIIRQLEWAGKK